jgi:predicted HAD superfamily hydrolase
MYSDVAVPRRLGIRTEPLGIACPNRYEKLMESFSDSTDGLASKFAGAARLARVSGFKYVGSEAVLWETGADVAGPILSAYVLWLLIQAQRSGLRRLYFLSRDGFLLHKIAQPLAAVLGLDIDLKYLYGSRQAWFHPIRKRLGHEHLSWLLHATSKISLRRILGRTGIEPEEVASCLEEKGFPRCEWDLNLEGADKERLGCILVDSQLANLIVSRAFQRQKSVIAYLEQEGLLKDKNWAIVDLGWNGSMQLSLASLLSSQGQDPPRGYYFRLFGRPESAGELTAYFADKSTGLGHISARPDWLTMEMFCTAGHGMTIGFEIKTNKIVPKFADCGEHLRLWGIETFQEAVISFAEHLDLKIDDQFLECDLRSMIARLSDLWWTQPEPRQANVWGHFPFEFEQVHKACQPIARPFTWLDCAQKIFQRKSDLRYESEWVEGSRVLTSHQKLLALHYGGRIRQVGALLKRFLRFGL